MEKRKSVLKLLKISKPAGKFESDISEVSEDIALQSRKILQMFVWWEASLWPHHTNVRFHISF